MTMILHDQQLASAAGDGAELPKHLAGAAFAAAEAEAEAEARKMAAEVRARKDERNIAGQEVEPARSDPSAGIDMATGDVADAAASDRSDPETDRSTASEVDAWMVGPPSSTTRPSVSEHTSRDRTLGRSERAAACPPSVPNARRQSHLASGGTGSAEPQVDVHEILRKLWRGRRLVLLTVVTGCLLGYAVVSNLTPHYSASASVMLETRQLQVLDAEEVLSDLALDSEVIEGEIELLRSRELAEDVVERLNLHEHPEFNPALAGSGSSSAWSDVLEYLPPEIAAYARDLLQGESVGREPAPTDQEAAVRTFLTKVDARQVGRSPVIRISFDSDDPRRAAEIANVVAETYVSAQLAAKHDATRRANDWIEERIGQLRSEVSEKERGIEAFRARSGLLEGREMPLEAQQMVELASQLVVARVERRTVEARLQQAERAGRTPAGAATVTEVLQSDLISNLRAQEAELLRDLTEAGLDYGPNHPHTISTQAKLADIQASIGREIDKIVLGIGNEADAARQREAGIQRELDAVAGRVKHNDAEAVKLRALESEVDAGRTFLESLFIRAQEIAQRDGIQRPDARIISTAQVPEQPAYPDKRLFMMLTFCASAFAGVSLAYVLQALERTFTTASQITEHLELPVLELVPTARVGRNTSPADCVVEHPICGHAEALRSLQVTLFATNRSPKSLLFTSSLPGEGKTSLALAFGHLLAMTGRSVVLVDCDLRRSSVHSAVGGHLARCGCRCAGLVDHLLGRATLDQIIQMNDATGLHFIASGTPAGAPSGLFASHAMHSAMSELEERFDVVLIDSPPVLAAVDTRRLQLLVEQTLFVVRWRSTNRATAREAVGRLRQTGPTPVGAVLNMVDPNAYGEYVAGYSYKAVRSYYGE